MDTFLYKSFADNSHIVELSSISNKDIEETRIIKGSLLFLKLLRESGGTLN